MQNDTEYIIHDDSTLFKFIKLLHYRHIVADKYVEFQVHRQANEVKYHDFLPQY